MRRASLAGTKTLADLVCAVLIDDPLEVLDTLLLDDVAIAAGAEVVGTTRAVVVAAGVAASAAPSVIGMLRDQFQLATPR